MYRPETTRSLRWELVQEVLSLLVVIAATCLLLFSHDLHTNLLGGFLLVGNLLMDIRREVSR
jgi:hypothetical protein